MSALARPACLLLAAYLALTAVPLAAAAAHAPGAARGALPAYAALLALAAWAATRGERWRPLGAALAAWLPLAAVPLLYATVPAVAAALAGPAAAGAAAPMHDARVLAWEFALFGRWLGDAGPGNGPALASPALAFAARWPHGWLGELLHAGYLSYYLVIYLPPLLLWRAGTRHPDARRAFAASAFTVLLAFVACYAVFVVFPVQGPWYTWPHPPAVPAGVARDVVQQLLAAGSSRGTAFPSSHVAVSVAQTLALAQVAPRLAVPVGVATLLLALGAVYGGFHYGVDVLAGAAVGLAAGVAGPWVWRRAAAAGLPR